MNGCFSLRWRVAALLLAASTLAGCAIAAQEETYGPGITGLDHLAEHLSIQNFWVDGHAGHQAGKGGSKVCCAKLPMRWRPGLTVTVRWGVTNWPAKVYSMHERVVPVEKYDEPGALYVHFLPDHSVRVIVSNIYPEHVKTYPGPSYATVLRKEPWKLYSQDRKPGDPRFELVPDATKAPE
jgi:hypothetical protein